MQKVKDTNPLETGQTAACTKYTPLMKRDESPVHFSSNMSKLFEPASTSNNFFFQQHDNVDPFDDGKDRRLQALIQNCLAGYLPRVGNGRVWVPYVRQFYYEGTEDSFSY